MDKNDFHPSPNTYPNLKDHTSFVSGDFFVKDYTKAPHNFSQVIRFYTLNKYPYVPRIRHIKGRVIFFEKIDIQTSFIEPKVLFEVLQDYHRYNILSLTVDEKLKAIDNYFSFLHFQKNIAFTVQGYEVFNDTQVNEWINLITGRFIQNDFSLCHGDFSRGNGTFFKGNYYLFDVDESRVLPAVYDFAHWQTKRMFSYDEGFEYYNFGDFLLALFLVEMRNLFSFSNHIAFENVNITDTLAKKKFFLQQLYRLYQDQGTLADFKKLDYFLLDYGYITHLSNSQ